MTHNQGHDDADFAGDIPPTKKVTMNCIATGNAPKLTKSKFNAGAAGPLHGVAKFLRGQLKLKDDETLFLFVK